ncbi:MAG: phosphoglucomutase/phosphomannomutase family protein [Candidatus Omnitrophica bacterium]|nr:phosphoglucomutase/phosphomannomutase family protein [Candidatus Omnitrophota bacterium]
MQEIRFGTDGWRGIISDNFTFENVRRLAQAIADYYNGPAGKRGGGQTKIAVGYDTRFLSDKYAQTVADVLSCNKINVILSQDFVPTPCLSFAVNSKRLNAGVMITASHNPPQYNGIKIKTASGAAAGLEVTKGIERCLKDKGKRIKEKGKGLIIKQDLSKDYIKFLRAYVNLKRLKKAKFHILVDVMHGSANFLLQRVLKDTPMRLEFLHADINPSFEGIPPEPILKNLTPTIKKMKSDSFDIGLVLDGDGDRIAAFGANTEFIHPQKILGLLALHLLRNRKMKGALIKTIAGTTLIDKITQKLGLKLYETPVGFKYISSLMEKENILVGGEEAGGIGFTKYIPERDGSLAALLLLEMMAYCKKPILQILREMEAEFGRYYYVRNDLHLSHVSGLGSQISNLIKKFKSKKELLGRKVICVKDFDGVKLICEDESWLMLRGSGTEPLLRFYAEAKTLKRAKQLLDFGRQSLAI